MRYENGKEYLAPDKRKTRRKQSKIDRLCDWREIMGREEGGKTETHSSQCKYLHDARCSNTGWPERWKIEKDRLEMYEMMRNETRKQIRETID